MNTQLSVLEHVRVASPCHESWHGMTGDDRARFCGSCRKNVYNLSALSRADAEALIIKHEGKLCVRYYQRVDGTILTQDCPVGLRALRWKLARTMGSVAAALGLALTALMALGKSRDSAGASRLAHMQPFKAIREKLTPAVATIIPPLPQQFEMLGAVAWPPPDDEFQDSFEDSPNSLNGSSPEQNGEIDRTKLRRQGT